MQNDRNFSFKPSGLRLAVCVVFLSSVVFSLNFDYVQSDGDPRGTGLSFCSDGRKKGHRLNSTVHGHRFALSPIDCMVQCVQEKCCRSTNYRKSHENTKENCELLHAVLSEEPENLQEDNDYNYNILLTPMKPFNCECSSCENNGRCEVSNKSCLCRPGFYGNRCQNGSLSSCDDPQALGMQSGEIRDAAITASSFWHPKLRPRYSRLNTRDSANSWCAWLKSDTDSNPWLQVDFGKEVVVTAVATQGSCGDREWTKTYVIWYSNDGTNWTYYQESGTTKIFTGNTDKNTVVTNSLQSPITARYVRISPKSWEAYASTRIEYYGCR